jgi:hypothetical protein
LKKRSLWLSVAAALVAAVSLAGCGSTTYFAGRTLPPSGLQYRVLIAVQNPSSLVKGSLVFVDAYYDIRYSYNSKVSGFSISGYSGALPSSIQNMPEEQLGYVYGYGDGSFTPVDYSEEKASTAKTVVSGLSGGVFVTRNQSYIFAANTSANVLTIIDGTSDGGTFSLSLPNVYKVSVNAGGSAALAFVRNSNYAYYPRKLTDAQTIAYSSGTSSWPKAAVDCEPQNVPKWCLFQAQSPDATDSTGNYYGDPLTFDRPVKAVFSADGSTAYVLSCGPECGGSISSVTPLPVAPLIYLSGQQSGTLPTTSTLSPVLIPGGASNALVSQSTMYVVGQQLQTDSLFSGYLTIVNLTSNTASSPISISDGIPGGSSRMILADDSTLWIGMTKCNNGERYAKGYDYGCLTMFNTSSKTVTMLEPYLGDLTGIAAVTGLHKVYVAQGGQIYIYSTVDGTSYNNQYVTVTGTAADVAYMDAKSDGNNTVY